MLSSLLVLEQKMIRVQSQPMCMKKMLRNTVEVSEAGELANVGHFAADKRTPGVAHHFLEAWPDLTIELSNQFVDLLFCVRFREKFAK